MTLYTPSSDKIVHETSVDFIQRSINEHIHIVQYDQSLPIIAVSLYADYIPYVVPENAEVNMRIKKLDGTFIYNRALGCNNDRTVVYFEISHQIAIAYGKLTPVVEIKIGSDTAASGKIVIDVDKNPVQDGDIESTNEYTVIEDYVKRAEDAANRSDDSASEALASQKAAKTSEEKALASQNAAKESETNALASQKAAKTSETNAKESETNAKNSENKALASEKAAKTSEEKALASQNAAKESETNAKESETNSKIYETNAEDSKNAAKESETNALASQKTAKTSETNAKDSEEKALASQNAAKESETNALASQKAAKTSETNAKESETNAKNSEDNAFDSEQAAKASEDNASGSEQAARTSERNAALSEQNARDAEENAEDSALKASNSEQAAKESETNALAFQKAAKTSETNAKESETNALASQKAAKTSETNAKESETNAKTSETQSKNYAQNAEESANRAENIAVELGKINTRIPLYVKELPEIGDETHLYIVVKDADHNLFDIYAWVNEGWLHMGGENIVFPTYLKCTVTLKTGDWSNGSQSKEIVHELLTDPLTDKDDIIIYPYGECVEEYFRTEIQTSQNGNTIKFTYSTKPKIDLTFMILVHVYCEVPTPTEYYDHKQIDEMLGALKQLTTSAKNNLVSAINEINNKANSLGANTIGDKAKLATDKKDTIVEAINEVHDQLEEEILRATETHNDFESRISDIESVVPEQASANNKLVDTDTLNSSLNSAAAFFRGNFQSKAKLDEWETSNPNKATNNDYAYVESDETHNNQSWRYLYVKEPGQDGHWEPQFKVNDAPFTAAQLAAINSGATEAVIKSISNKLDKKTTTSTLYAVDASGAQVMLPQSTFATAAQGKTADLNAKNIGTISQLLTEEKGSLVLAINEVLEQIGSVQKTAESKYSKPVGGITETDLNESVKAAIALARTALQSFTETDPTVPAWAKASKKPEYSWSEINGTPILSKVATSGSYNDLIDTPDAYVLPEATDSALGGVKVGYKSSGKNYAVQLLNGQMYVNVPWSDTHFTSHIYIGESGQASNSAISNPYIKLYDNTTARESYKISGSGSVTVKSDANGNITISGVNTTYSSGTGIKIVGGAITHEDYGEAGEYGPAQSETLKFGGTFIIPYFETNEQGHIISAGTRTITMPANPNSNTWRQINIQNSAGTSLGTLGTGTSTGALTLKAGSNITLEYLSGVVTIKSSYVDTTYSAGTGIAFNGTTINHKNSITEGTKISGTEGGAVGFGKTFTVPYFSYDAQGHITDSGVKTYTLPANPNTDTHYTTHLYVGANGQATNAATANGETYLKLYDNSVARESHKISGGQGVSVESDETGNITIKGPDLSNYLPKSGGTLTGNLTGKYMIATWFQATATSALASETKPSYFAVFDAQNWIYKRSLSDILTDIGAASSSHTHDGYVLKSGDTIDGILTLSSKLKFTSLDNPYIELIGGTSKHKFYLQTTASADSIGLGGSWANSLRVSYNGDVSVIGDITLAKTIKHGSATLTLPIGSGTFALESFVTESIINSQDYSISGTNTSMGVTANYGTVKRPSSLDKSKFLRGDNTWVEIEAPAISKPISVTVSSSSWSTGNTVTLTSTNNAGIKNVSTSSYVEISPDSASSKTYLDCDVRATSLGSGSITLTAAKKPTVSITVQIMIL